jgi:hypothetical protein
MYQFLYWDIFLTWVVVYQANIQPSSFSIISHKIYRLFSSLDKIDGITKAPMRAAFFGALTRPFGCHVPNHGSAWGKSNDLLDPPHAGLTTMIHMLYSIFFIFYIIMH